MRFALLGPLVVIGGTGSEVTVAGPRLRVLLAALLLHANLPVPAGELAEAVWDGLPPSGAIATLRSYVRRLRRAIDPEGERIAASGSGYVMSVGQTELDVLEFEALCRDARAAVRAGEWAGASTAATRALGLWRAVPLLDVPAEALRAEFVPGLERLRLQVLEDHADAGLRLGHHQELVPQLLNMTARYPLRERFHAQLMQALAGCGRQAEALAAYQDARKVIAGELGIEPGPDLRQLHERILAGEDDGDAVAPCPPGGPVAGGEPVATVPRQLPAASGHFTGRRGELELIAGLSREADAPGGTVVISAIDGMAGVGKTALAVQAAHRLTGGFPGGQLFIDLHGYTKGQPPREPGDALGTLLRVLEVPPQQIPAQLEERAALYRQRLAGTRTLVVLDNAASEAQVRPLLPGTAGCLVLVTSRRRLRGLHDARVVSLDVLPEADAVALLDAVTGPGRAAGPELAEIAGLCGRLPLALRIAGSLLRHRPAWTPGYLAGLLRDERRRLAVLADGDHDLDAVLGLSYAALGERQWLLLRRLALAPGPDLDAYAAAALLDADPAAAGRLLEDLVDHNLLIDYAPGRYRLHDLVRAHASTLAEGDPQADRGSALDRLLGYYAHTAQVASALIARCPRPAPGGPAPCHAPALPGPGAAWAWLRAEHDSLQAAHDHARGLGLDGHAVALAAGLAEILRTDGPLDRAQDVHQAAADTAGRRGWPAGRATALTDLASVRVLTADLAEAAAAANRAVQACRAAGSRLGEAAALTELARTLTLAGDLAGAAAAASQALEFYRAAGSRPGEAAALTELARIQVLTLDLAGAAAAASQALEIYRAAGNQLGEADALSDLACVQVLAGDLAGAAAAASRALEAYRAAGSRLGEASALTELARIRILAADPAGAAAAASRALEIYRAAGSRLGEAAALGELGRARLAAGDPPGARDALSAALETYRAMGSRNGEAWALNHYAAVAAATGDIPRALALYQQALAMNRELGKPDDEAIALEGTGECLLSAGQAKAGTAHLSQALQIYQRMGMKPDVKRVRGRLASATPGGHADVGPASQASVAELVK